MKDLFLVNSSQTHNFQVFSRNQFAMNQSNLINTKGQGFSLAKKQRKFQNKLKLNNKVSNQQNINSMRSQAFCQFPEIALEGWQYVDGQSPEKYRTKNNNVLLQKSGNHAIKQKAIKYKEYKSRNKSIKRGNKSQAAQSQQKSGNYKIESILQESENILTTQKLQNKSTFRNTCLSKKNNGFQEQIQTDSSHIDVLKSHAKYLESQQFVRESNQEKKQNKIRENLRNSKFSKKEELITKLKNQADSIRNELKINGSCSTKSEIQRSFSMQSDAPFHTFYQCKKGKSNSLYKSYKKTQDQLINQTVHQNLKVTSTDARNMKLSTENSFKICENTQKDMMVPTSTIHHNKNLKTPFHKFFNRKRKTKQKTFMKKTLQTDCKTRTLINQSPGANQSKNTKKDDKNQFITGIEGRKINKMLNNAHHLRAITHTSTLKDNQEYFNYI